MCGSCQYLHCDVSQLFVLKEDAEDALPLDGCRHFHVDVICCATKHCRIEIVWPIGGQQHK
jgi:hypothetical protein